jgi:hypothetical protein
MESYKRLAPKQNVENLLDSKEGNFTKDIRMKVNRETSLIEKEQSVITDACKNLSVKDFLGSIFDDAVGREDDKLNIDKEVSLYVKNKAAILIQSNFRGFKLRRFVR